MRGSRLTGVALAAIVAAGSGLSAHRLDECLQAARVAIEPDRITLELDVTPGVAIVESFMPDLDRDGNGAIAADEQQACIRRVLGAIELSLDGRPLEVADGTGTFPEVAALLRGEGTIQLHASVAIPQQSAGVHRVFFRNRYRGDVSVYLANALVPESDRVAVSGQQHSAEQRDLTIDYEVRAEGPVMLWPWVLGATAIALAVGSTWGERMKRGRLESTLGNR